MILFSSISGPARSRSAALGALVVASALGAQPAASTAQRYVKTNHMVAMRDGVRLNTDVYVPRDQPGPLPFIMLRTPYGIDNAAGRLSTSLKELADDGYIFVFQDLRGRYKSDGKFVMQRPARSVTRRRDPKAIDEATDAYDTVKWLLENVANNNGRAGIYAARPVGERRNGGRRVAHVRRCSFRSPAGFYLPADCGQ